MSLEKKTVLQSLGIEQGTICNELYQPELSISLEKKTVLQSLGIEQGTLHPSRMKMTTTVVAIYIRL